MFFQSAIMNAERNKDALFHSMMNVPSWLPVLFMLTCCSPSTQITGSWKNPDLERRSIKKVLVTAISTREAARRILESDLALALQLKGLAVEEGMTLLGPQVAGATEQARDSVLAKIKGTEIDAILTVALINDETGNRFVPGRYEYDPIQQFEYYRGFWPYFSYRQPTINTPGFDEEDRVYFLEINLYDAATEELLWSAQSETHSPGDLSVVSRGFTAVVIDKMEDDGIIR